MWFGLAALAGLASAFDKVLNRAALKDRGNSLAYSVVYSFLVGLVSLPFVFPLEIQFNSVVVLQIVLLSVFWAGASATMFLAHTSTDVSLSSIISRTRILWIIPFGYLILGERVSSASVLGTFVVFIGLAILFIKGDYHKHKGVHLVFLSSIFAALGSVLNSSLIKMSISPVQVTFIMYLGQTLVLIAVLITRGNFIQKLLSVLKYSWYLTFAAVILEVVAYTLLNYSYSLGNTSSATSVYVAMSIVVVWVGVVFLKERKEIGKKIISSIIVTIGVIILKLFS